jgi:hypothetical protein
MRPSKKTPRYAPRDPELTAFIVVLREALQNLCDVLDDESHDGPLKVVYAMYRQAAHSYARSVLAMETGRHAQEEIQITNLLAMHGFTLADYLYPLLNNGASRSRSKVFPTLADAQESLRAMSELAAQSRALSALLEEPPR